MPTDRGLAILFVALWVTSGLWSPYFEDAEGELSLLPCPVREITSVRCPGCGMTRSCLALARGDLSESWKLQPFAWALVPFAACYAIAPRFAVVADGMGGHRGGEVASSLAVQEMKETGIEMHRGFLFICLGGRI